VLRFFNLLDRAFDALARAFDGRNGPEKPRSRPQAILFLLALVLVPCAVVLGWELSPWLLGVLGLIAVLVSAGLYAVWTSSQPGGVNFGHERVSPEILESARRAQGTPGSGRAPKSSS
jgi:hypothetical protein